MDQLIARLQAVSRLGQHSKEVAAVAAYEDAPTEARVSEFCRSFKRQLGGKCEVTPQMWLFTELRVPQLRTIAAGEASRADVVIISIHHAQSFPEEVKAWIDLWVRPKGSGPAALLALFDPLYVGDSTALQSYLKEAARKGKMEFLMRAEERPDED